MDANLIFKITAVGILTSEFNHVLTRGTGMG